MHYFLYRLKKKKARLLGRRRPDKKAGRSRGARQAEGNKRLKHGAPRRHEKQVTPGWLAGGDEAARFCRSRACHLRYVLFSCVAMACEKRPLFLYVLNV